MLSRQISLKSLLCVLVGMFVSTTSFGADTNNIVANIVQKAWNAPVEQATGFDHNLVTGCVGSSLPGCAVWPHVPKHVDGVSSVTNRGTSEDHGTILMLVARKMNNHGAEFCATQIEAANQDGHPSGGAAWTTYYYPTGAESNCIWLCQDGYYGEECKSTIASGFSSENIKQEEYINYKRVTSGQNIENKLPMFLMNKYVERDVGGRDVKEEYDTILAVTDFLESGNGAWVAPVAVRAYMYEYDNGKTWFWGNWEHYYISTPYLTVPDGVKKTLVCKDGYKSNNALNDKDKDCVVYSKLAEQKIKDAEEEKRLSLAQSCGTFWNSYNESQHEKILTKDERFNEDCYKYLCKDPLKGFASDKDHTCVDCSNGKRIKDNGVCVDIPPCTSGDFRYAAFDNAKHKKKNVGSGDDVCYEYRCLDINSGFQSDTDHSCIDCSGDTRKYNVSPAGVCVKCRTGYIYDTESATGDYCTKAEEITRDRLLYGLGGSSASATENQCWTFSNNEDYEICVEQGATVAKQNIINRETKRLEETTNTTGLNR